MWLSKSASTHEAGKPAQFITCMKCCTLASLRSREISPCTTFDCLKMWVDNSVMSKQQIRWWPINHAQMDVLALAKSRSWPTMLRTAAFQGAYPVHPFGADPFLSPSPSLTSLFIPYLWLGLPFPFCQKEPQDPTRSGDICELFQWGLGRNSGRKSISGTFWPHKMCLVKTVLVLFLGTKMGMWTKRVSVQSTCTLLRGLIIDTMGGLCYVVSAGGQSVIWGLLPPHPNSYVSALVFDNLKN